MQKITVKKILKKKTIHFTLFLVVSTCPVSDVNAGVADAGAGAGVRIISAAVGSEIDLRRVDFTEFELFLLFSGDWEFM